MVVEGLYTLRTFGAAHVFWGLPARATVAVGEFNGFLGVYAAAIVSTRLAGEAAVPQSSRWFVEYRKRVPCSFDGPRLVDSVMDSSTHPTPLAAVEATDLSPGYSLSIEIDESSRFVATTTFRHVEETTTLLPDAPEVVAALAKGYGNAA